jgi:CBS domain-containing protein
MMIKNAMTGPARSIGPQCTAAEAAAVMNREAIGVLPITEGGKLLGIVTDRDICCRMVAKGLNPNTTRVDEIMSEPVATCHEDQDLYDAASLMERKRILRVPVLDREDRLVGILTLGDLSRRASPDLTAEVESIVSWR